LYQKARAGASAAAEQEIAFAGEKGRLLPNKSVFWAEIFAKPREKRAS
jgi:hypothetical protein